MWDTLFESASSVVRHLLTTATGDPAPAPTAGASSLGVFDWSATPALPPHASSSSANATTPPYAGAMGGRNVLPLVGPANEKAAAPHLAGQAHPQLTTPQIWTAPQPARSMDARAPLIWKPPRCARLRHAWVTLHRSVVPRSDRWACALQLGCPRLPRAREEWPAPSARAAARAVGVTEPANLAAAAMPAKNATAPCECTHAHCIHMPYRTWRIANYPPTSMHPVCSWHILQRECPYVPQPCPRRNWPQNQRSDPWQK
jgi:hypothetical protein